MQKFFAGEEKLAEPHLSTWSRLGPALLLGAFAVLLFKCAPLYTPFAAAAFFGYAATRLWGKGGLSLSLVALALVLVFRPTHELLWMALLSGSIAISWLLIYFDGQERAAFEEGWNEKLCALDKQRQDIERQCLETRLKLSEEQRQCSAERQRAHDLSAEISLVCSQSRGALESFEQEIRSHQQKNAALQVSLDESSARVSALEEQLSSITRAQAQEPAEEETGLQELKHQYALLREQFEEKSATLDQTRKELFRAEQNLLSLQKTTEEQELAPCEEIQAFCKDLCALEKEVGDREHLISSLEDFASSLLLPPKKRPPSKKRKNPRGGEELLLESLIKP